MSCLSDTVIHNVQLFFAKADKIHIAISFLQYKQHLPVVSNDDARRGAQVTRGQKPKTDSFIALCFLNMSEPEPLVSFGSIIIHYEFMSLQSCYLSNLSLFNIFITLCPLDIGTRLYIAPNQVTQPESPASVGKFHLHFALMNRVKQFTNVA